MKRLDCSLLYFTKYFSGIKHLNCKNQWLFFSPKNLRIPFWYHFTSLNIIGPTCFPPSCNCQKVFVMANTNRKKIFLTSPFFREIGTKTIVKNHAISLWQTLFRRFLCRRPSPFHSVNWTAWIMKKVYIVLVARSY